MQSLHPAIQQALRPLNPAPAPKLADLNDDDIYVYEVDTGRIVSTIGCKSLRYPVSVIGARIDVPRGCTWDKGMRLRHVGLWWGARS